MKEVPVPNPVFTITPNASTTAPSDSAYSTVSSREDLLPVSKEDKHKSCKMGYCRFRCDWLVNAFIILSILGLIVVLELRLIPFRQFGFLCGDPKLSFKFTGDTVSMGALFGTTLIAPLVSLLLVELLVSSMTESSKYKAHGAEKKADLGWVKQALSWYSQFILGLLLVIFITEAGKNIVREPRPHFFDTCQPDAAVNCTSGYVTSFRCTNGTISRILVEDSTKSFPSGHAAIGVYMALFMIWFFQSRVPDTSYLVVPWLQCVFATWGMLCALTRITDHRHHWWDVLVGSLCGVAIGVYTVKVYSKSFCLHSGTAAPAHNTDKTTHEVNSNGRYPSSRRLLSSTSSYTPADDRELREVQMP